MFFGLAIGVVVAVFLSVSVFMLRISQLELSTEHSEAGVLLKVKGALFYASLAHLTEQFHSHFGKNLTVDLQFTTHIDQSAVDFFIRESRNMAAQGLKLTLLINDKQGHFMKRLGANSDIELVAV
jgi:MFS superfamily sulfate permease-like transporter